MAPCAVALDGGQGMTQNRLAFWIAVLVVGVGASGGASGANNSWSFVGPDGGPAWSIAIHPTNPDILLASTWRGLARSTDRGHSWDVITDGFLGAPVPIAFDPGTPSRVFTAGPYFMLSEDTGATFKPAQGPSAPNGISHLVFTSDGTLYAMLYLHGAAKSTAPFVAWTNLPVPWPANTTPSAVGTVASNPSLLFVGVYEHGIYRTTNGGTSWSGPLNLGISNLAQFSVNRIEVDPHNAQIVFAATSQGLYRSLNQGDTWTAINGPTTSVAINPANSSLVTALYYGGAVIRSSDGGDTWPGTGNGFQLLVTGNPQGYFVPDDPGRMWFISDYGVAESPDAGTTFIMRNSGLRGSTILRLVSADDHTVYAGLNSASGSIFRRASTAYQPLNVAAYVSSIQSIRNLSALSVAASDSNRIVAVNSGVSLIQTLNGGASWSTPHPAFTAGSPDDFISDVAIAPSNPNIVYVGRGVSGVWKTSNGGSTYSPLANSPHYIRKIAVDPADGNVVFVSGGSTSNGTGIYKTSDGGQTWQQKRAPDGTLWFQSFSFSPVDSNLIYASAPGAVLKTIDGGDHWSLVDFGGRTGTTPVGTSVLFDPLIPTTITMFNIGAESGFARSVDGGLTWSETPLAIAGPITGFEAALMLGPGELIAGTSTAGVVEYTVAPDLSISIDGLTSPIAADAAASGQVTVRNLGPHAVSAAEIIVTLPSWLSVTLPPNCTRANSILTCQMPALGVDQTFAVPLALAVPQTPGTGQIAAEVTGHEPDPDTANNRVALPIASTVQAPIDLVMSTSTPTVAHNANVLFTATLSNPGPSLARQAQVELQLGTISATEVTAANNACTRTGAVVSCNLGNLAAGSSATVSVRGDVTAIGANNVTGSATRAGGDAEATDTATLAIQGQAVADMAVEIAGTPATVLAGAAVNYTVTVRNSGPDPASSSVGLQFAGVAVTGASTAGGACTAPGATMTCTMNSIANGGSATITVNATAGAAGSGTVNATVTVDGVDNGAGNNAGSATTTITAPPAPPRNPGGGGGGRFDWLFLALSGLLLVGRQRCRLSGAD